MPGFDCFISHNSQDKPAVRALKDALAARGLHCWLDEEQLRPGLPWPDLLEQGIRGAGSVAVCIAADGIGPWQNEEMQSALRLAVRDKRPVIPVLLPGAPANRPDLPLFLGNRTWVDLRAGLAESALARLIWGIAGERPAAARGPAPVPADGPLTIPSETQFLDEVFELLYRYPTLMLLAQSDRDLGAALEHLRRRAQGRYGSGRVLHLAPPRDPRASESEFFAAPGGRAGMDPVPRTPAGFESALESRLAAGERLFLPSGGLDACSDTGRERLADCLRGLSEFHGEALRLVLVGGEGLAGLKYAQGTLSLLSHAEPRHWPEWNTGDLMDQARRGQPPLALDPEDALALLVASGGHPRLVLEALHGRARGRALAECIAGLERSGQIESQFVGLARDPNRRRALADALAQEDLGPWQGWIWDDLLRRLYWLNLLRADGAAGEQRLVWRCPAVVRVGLRVLS
jgi:hypothetical protein